ncbi:MAG: hypothetical protein GY705_27495 [Bacteroidetes bacterium]|nr:hypothetical protein [Bacteroidota bacterium]
MKLTEDVKEGLKLIDVRILDHIIVSPDETMSFADNGIMPA